MESERVLRTERQVLRPIRDTDIENVHRALSHPKVIKYYAVQYLTLEATEEQMKWFRNIVANETGQWWALEESSSESFVGGIGITSIDKKHKRGELGYWLLPEYWNKGFMREALSAVIGFAFKELGLHRLMAEVETENKSIRKLVQGLGFKHVGTLREVEKGDSNWISLDIFGLLSTDQKSI